MKPAINFYLDSTVIELRFPNGLYAFIYYTVEEHWPEMLMISHVPYEAFKLLDTEQQFNVSDQVDLMDFWAIPDLLNDDELQCRIQMLFSAYPIAYRVLYKILYAWLKDITEKHPETAQQLTDLFFTELGELIEDLDQED